MIDQERVREMTHMAILETGKGEKELHISSYRKGDYISLQLIRGFIAGTICFAAFVLIWIMWRWDTLNQYFADADFEGFFIKVLIRYFIFLGAYLVLTGGVAAHRYKNCKERERKYLKYLNRLGKSYSLDTENEEKEEA